MVHFEAVFHLHDRWCHTGMLCWFAGCLALTPLLVRLVVFHCHLHIFHHHHPSRWLWHSVVRVHYSGRFTFTSSQSSDVPQTLVFSAVVAVSLFNGLNTNVWTGWVFFAILLGIVLLLLYTVPLLLCSLHFKGSFLSYSSYIMLSAQAGL